MEGKKVTPQKLQRDEEGKKNLCRLKPHDILAPLKLCLLNKGKKVRGRIKRKKKKEKNQKQH